MMVCCAAVLLWVGIKANAGAGRQLHAKDTTVHRSGLAPPTLCPLQNLNLADDLTDDDEDDRDVCDHPPADDDLTSSVCVWRCLPVTA